MACPLTVLYTDIFLGSLPAIRLFLEEGLGETGGASENFTESQ
jgi:hypothetical protein